MIEKTIFLLAVFAEIFVSTGGGPDMTSHQTFSLNLNL